MVDLTPFKAGIDAAISARPQVCHDPRGAFMDLLASYGFSAPKSLTIGNLERIGGPEDRGHKKSGWYVYNEIDDNQQSGHIIGLASFGDWKSGISESWCSRSEHKMDADERNRYNKAREEMRIQREAEEAERHKEAAHLAYEIWQNAKEARASAGYLRRKGVGASPYMKETFDKDSGGVLVLPIQSDDDHIMSLQFIRNEGDFYIDGESIGNKKMLAGGKKSGGFFKIEGAVDTVYIAEGYATGRSVHEATGKTVYVCFDAGNIYEVTATVCERHSNSNIIIAGDDDFNTDGNAGRTKAEQAAEGNGVRCIFPAGFNDFNDMHKAQGIDALKQYLVPDNEAYKPDRKDDEKHDIDWPSGVLGDIANYYNATSGNKQYGFAIQTALATCSIILGRAFKTSLDNFSSLYLLNVAKSGTGKEHAKTVVEKILYQSGQGHLVAGDGYTSAGAVFSTLLDRPKHISVIDEFGRYLEAGRDMGKGNQHQREANTKLMEAITRSPSVIRPPSYSSMTLKKDAAEAIKNRYVHNPAITLLTMTTPDTLFKTLDMGAIKDGFINRFIISISDAERSVRMHKPPIDVPERILNWIYAVTARNDNPHIAMEPASPIVIEFCNEALDMSHKFQLECIEKANSLDKFGMGELPMRGNEMAMKVSLICALSRDPNAKSINVKDMEWSINYVRKCMFSTIDSLKFTISHSEFEQHKKEVLSDLRKRGADGITWAQMQKTAPYSQHKTKYLKEILDAIKDADLAGDEPYQPKKGGRPTIKWMAIK